MGVGSDNSQRRTADYLARVGHDLRTPLNAVLGMLELSLAEPLSYTLRDHLLTARNAARGLANTLDDVLALAEVDAGNRTFDVAPVRLSEVIQDAMSAAEQAAGKPQLSYIVLISPTLPNDLCGDARRLRQIITHLIDYASNRVDRRQMVVEVAERLVTADCAAGTRHLGIWFGYSRRNKACTFPAGQ